MIRALERSLPYLLLVPSLLPLIFLGGMLYPYLAPKTLFFRADMLLACAAFLTLALSGARFFYARLRHPATWIPGALLVWAYVASVAGIDFYHSFWSVYDRGDGLLTLTGLVASFYLLILTLDERMVERIFKWVSVVASVTAVLALIQWLEGVSGIPLSLIPDSPGRVGGTMGNAAFLAAYLGLAFFITIAIARRLSDTWRTRAYVGAGLQLAAIFATATRGTAIALVAAAGLALLYTAVRGSHSYRRYAQAMLVAGLIIVALFVVFREQLKSVPIATVSRLASISLTDTTVESRLFIWGAVGQEALFSPLTGVGAEHIQILFNRVYDPMAIVEQWFDRTHNVYLDYFVQFGVVGLALYLALLAVFAYRAFRLAHEKDPESARLGQLLILLLVVCVVQNFFLFDTVVTLWTILTLFAILFVSNDEKSVLALPRVPFLVAGGAGALVALLIIPVSFMPLRANFLLADGYLYHVANVSRANASMKAGLAIGTYADLEYGYQLYEMYSDRQSVMLSGGDRMKAWQFARDVLSANYARYPYDARTATYFAHVLDMAPPEANQDEEQLRSVIAHAIELSPKRIQPWYLLTNISIRAGDALPVGSPEKQQFYQFAVEALADYSSVVPDFPEPRFVIATLYLTMGDRVQAAEWAEGALPLYTRRDENTARRAARYYVTVEDWENAEFFLSEVVASSDPVDLDAKYDLAKVKYMLGKEEESRALAEELEIEAPGILETDPAFMAALNGGGQ